MKNGYYESRKEQIEREVARELVKALKGEGVAITSRARTHIKKALRDAAMIGAFAERDRVLTLPEADARLKEKVIEEAVLAVIGYDD